MNKQQETDIAYCEDITDKFVSMLSYGTKAEMAAAVNYAKAKVDDLKTCSCDRHNFKKVLPLLRKQLREFN
jgi:hypothetical protein